MYIKKKKYFLMCKKKKEKLKFCLIFYKMKKTSSIPII